jgi:twitching motility protein PilT
MADFLRDPSLDEMVRRLNQGVATPEVEPAEIEPDAGAPLPASTTLTSESDPLVRLLQQVVRRGATDLLLVPGSPPVLRVGGRLVAADASPLDEDEVRGLFTPHLSARLLQALQSEGAVDLGLRVAGSGERPWRFRVNIHRQRSGLAAAVRALPREVPTLPGLSLPTSLAELVRTAQGLVLVCGPAGSGKTTTLAALVGEVNRTRTCHVITIEDPIEFEHPTGASLVEQVEVGADTPSFAAALRAALRQDPDVIVVGEMRDLETISIALTAAETGHLVLSTLHSHDVAHAVHRIVDVFPAAQQSQIRQQLALSLHAVVCQHLLPRASGTGRIPAVEVLLANTAVRQHIRRERVQNLHQEITLGKRQGMISLEESLAGLVRRGLVALEEAQLRTAHQEELDALLRG